MMPTRFGLPIGPIVVSVLLLNPGIVFASPDHSDALSQIQASLTEELGDQTILADMGTLKYENGFAKDDNNYIVDVTYKVLNKINFDQFKRILQAADQSEFSKHCAFQYPCNFWFQSVLARKLIGKPMMVPGEEIVLERQYLFLKTEKGWINQGSLD